MIFLVVLLGEGTLAEGDWAARWADKSYGVAVKAGEDEDTLAEAEMKWLREAVARRE